MNYSKHMSTKNNSGGPAFHIDKWEQLQRFLILGSEGGTFYVKEAPLTQQNATNVIACIKENGTKVVKAIKDVSIEGRAPKNDPAIFALALAATHGDLFTKEAAYGAIPKVCRTGTHLFTFCEAVTSMRGWSRGLRSGVASFYTEKTPSAIEYQLIKYRQRNGWSHRDVLRLCHPKSAALNTAFKWAVHPEVYLDLEARATIPLIDSFTAVQHPDISVDTTVALIKEYGLPWEALPTTALKNPAIWEALVPDMPLTALTRNLGKLGSIGLLSSNFDAMTKVVTNKLSDVEAIKKSRLHPLSILNTLKTYSSGHGVKGSLTWTPVTKVVDALDEAFYTAFGNIEPINNGVVIGVDVSGSMGWGSIAGMSITPREASAALSLIIARTEPLHEILLFTDKIETMTISPKARLSSVVEAVENLAFGATDCAAPIIYAAKKGLPVSSFIVITDNETNSGRTSPCKALAVYRAQTGRDARLAVMATTATPFTVADPNDAGMMDVVGFDTATPSIVNDFLRGTI